MYSKVNNPNENNLGHVIKYEVSDASTLKYNPRITSENNRVAAFNRKQKIYVKNNLVVDDFLTNIDIEKAYGLVMKDGPYLFSAIINDANIKKIDTLEGPITSYYREKLTTNLNNLNKNAPSFLVGLGSGFETYQKYIYIICFIVYINGHRSELIDKIDMNELIEWSNLREDMNFDFILNGPNTNQEINRDYKKHYALLVSSANELSDAVQYQTLSRQETGNKLLTTIQNNLISRPNSYFKNLNQAQKYIINIDSSRDVQLYEDSEYNLVFDCAKVTLGDVVTQNIVATYKNIDNVVESGQSVSKIAVGKLTDIFHAYSVIKVLNLIIGKETYVSKLDAYDKIFLVFKGLYCSDRNLYNITSSGWLKIEGNFTSTNDGYVFNPTIKDGISYKSTQISIKSFDIFLSVDPDIPSTISNNYPIINFDSSVVFQHPVAINITDTYDYTSTYPEIMHDLCVFILDVMYSDNSIVSTANGTYLYSDIRGLIQTMNTNTLKFDNVYNIIDNRAYYLYYEQVYLNRAIFIGNWNVSYYVYDNTLLTPSVDNFYKYWFVDQFGNELTIRTTSTVFTDNTGNALTIPYYESTDDGSSVIQFTKTGDVYTMSSIQLVDSITYYYIMTFDSTTQLTTISRLTYTLTFDSTGTITSTFPTTDVSINTYDRRTDSEYETKSNIFKAYKCSGFSPIYDYWNQNDFGASLMYCNIGKIISYVPSDYVVDSSTINININPDSYAYTFSNEKYTRITDRVNILPGEILEYDPTRNAFVRSSMTEIYLNLSDNTYLIEEGTHNFTLGTPGTGTIYVTDEYILTFPLPTLGDNMITFTLSDNSEAIGSINYVFSNTLTGVMTNDTGHNAGTATAAQTEIFYESYVMQVNYAYDSTDLIISKVIVMTYKYRIYRFYFDGSVVNQTLIPTLRFSNRATDSPPSVSTPKNIGLDLGIEQLSYAYVSYTMKIFSAPRYETSYGKFLTIVRINNENILTDNVYIRNKNIPTPIGHDETYNIANTIDDNTLFLIESLNTKFIMLGNIPKYGKIEDSAITARVIFLIPTIPKLRLSIEFM